MNLFQLVLIVAIPAAGLLLLWILLGRWSKKRDPMGGSWKDVWSTTGTSTRHDQDGD